MSPRSRRHWAVGAAAAFVAALAFSFLAYEVFTPPGTDRLDHDAATWAAGLAWPGGIRTVIAVSWIGTAGYLVPATLLAGLVLAVRGWRAGAGLFIVSVVWGFLFEAGLKMVFHRPRPTLHPLAVETGFGFPSGHTTMVTVFFGGVAGLVWRATRRPAPRALSVLAAATVVFVVGLSRLSLGVHWLTDVLGGALVGLFWVIVSSMAFDLAPAPSPRR